MGRRHRHGGQRALPRGGLTFDTPIGRCRIEWGDAGLTGVRLPPAEGPAAGDPPPGVVERITGLLAGEPDDLADVELDWRDVGTFERDVYEALRRVPPGCTTTYGELARLAGHPGRAQRVGRALGRNPFPIVVPCHRVVGADRRLVGFSAPGGVETKSRILAIEGAQLL